MKKALLAGVAVDASGNLYIADTSNNAIRKVAADGPSRRRPGTEPRDTRAIAASLPAPNSIRLTAWPWTPPATSTSRIRKAAGSARRRPTASSRRWPGTEADTGAVVAPLPALTGQPNVSTLNSWTRKVAANAALVPAGTNESISVFVDDPTDLILDINGYFGQPGNPRAFSFYPVTPCRVADTRGAPGPFGGPEMAAATTRSFAIPASACNIPSTAAAYSLNVTVVPDGPLSYLAAWPAGSSQPFVSTLNSWDGTVVANAAIVPAGVDGGISVYVTNPTHVILDINGYFAP